MVPTVLIWFQRLYGQSPIYFSTRFYDPYAQVPRQLGAGVPLTILRFAPLAQLHSVSGFSRLNLRVSQVQTTRVHFVDAETTSLKRETSRRPNFFVFRPIEVPKEPRQGFWDALKPLE
jgi:hypothetical protein